MIKIGTDIEEILRFENKDEKFLNRCFHKSEIEYCMKHKNYAQNFAGRFCAKEALAKAVGHAGSWLDAEIINNEKGKPEVILYGGLKDELAGAKIDVSISHCKNYATATVIIYEEN